MANLSNIDNKFLVTTGGNIGIGDTGPTRSLSILRSEAVVNVKSSGVSGHSMIILDHASSANNYSQVRFSNAGSAKFAIGIDPQDSYKLKIVNDGNATGANTRMTITTGGNVGIGTITPTNKLTIRDPSANGSITDTIPSWWGQVIDRAYSTSSTAAMGLVGGTIATGSSGRLHLGNSDDVDNTYIDGGANQMHFNVNGLALTLLSTNATFAGNVTITEDKWLKIDTTWGARNAFGGTDDGATYARTLIRSIDNSATSGIDFQNYAGSSVVRILDGGNVGIGIAAPSVRLYVYDSSTDAVLYVDSGNANGSHMRFLASGSVKHFVGSGGGFGLGDVDDFGIRAYDNILFATGNSSTERMRIRSDGGIAIGAGNVGYASQILSVKSGAADSVFYGESTDANCFASFRDNSSTANIEYGAIGNNHVFRKDASEQMRIDSSGHVGIGVVPNAPAGNIQLDVGDNGCGMTSRQNNELVLQANANYSTYAQTGVPATRLNLTNTGEFHFLNAPAGAAIGDTITFTERMRIASGGEVLIGTTAVVTDVKLRVVQTAQTWTAQFVNTDSSVAYGVSIDTSASSYGAAGTLQCYTNTGVGFKVQNDGKVGIGTTSPAKKLDVQGAGGDGIRVSNSTNPAYYSDLLINHNDVSSMQLTCMGTSILQAGNTGNTVLASRTNKDIILSPSGTGKVGIGTTSPGAALDISSSYSIQGGVYTYYYTGTGIGWTAINLDITVNDEGGGGNVFKIEAGFAHYYAMVHNAIGEWWSTTRGTAIVNTYILNAGSTYAGSWSASKPDVDTLRITKSAGTYGGGGKYWVKVTYRPY